MEKRIKNYLNCIDELLASDREINEETIENHLTQISFFQHERLVHLIVTMLFALLEMMAIMLLLITEQFQIVALVVILMVLLVPYIRHYYILENGVQKMYSQWDRMIEKKKSVQ